MWLYQVYKSVLMTNGEYDSIIAFYNRIFMQSLKTFIVQFATSRVESVTFLNNSIYSISVAIVKA